jgi:hypothetical protein
VRYPGRELLESDAVRCRDSLAIESGSIIPAGDIAGLSPTQYDMMVNKAHCRLSVEAAGEQPIPQGLCWMVRGEGLLWVEGTCTRSPGNTRKGGIPIKQTARSGKEMLCENSLPSTQKVRSRTTHDPPTPALGTYPRGLKTCTHKNLCTNVHSSSIQICTSL